MSGRARVFEPGDPQAQQPQGAPNTTRQSLQIGSWPLDRPFPVLLTPDDLRQVFQISQSYYFRLKALGRFRRFELSSAVLEKGSTRYSGALVKAYVLNEFTTARTFGAKRGPRVPVGVIHESQGATRTE